MPAFNGERFIEKQILSILNQTHKAIELIIVDDRSSDRTAEIVSNLAETYPQIKLYCNSENLGFNKNFEKAISLASHDFIALSDQDDIWLPNKLEDLLSSIGDNWVVFSNSSLIDENDKYMEDSLLNDFSLERRSFRSICLNNFVTGHTVLFKKELLKLALPIPPQGYYDWWLGFVALYHNKLFFLNKVLTLYRKHNDSVIQQQEKLVANSEISRATLDYRSTITGLDNFRNYKLLSKRDKRFLSQLYYVYKQKDSNPLPLTLFYYFYFNILFPDLKKRKLISKTRWKLAKQLASPEV